MSYWESGVPWGHLLGLAGVAVYIGAYFALQAGLVKGQGYAYAGLNTIAACLVLISLAKNFNLPSAVIQVTYISISIFGMVRFYLLTQHIRFSDEEAGVLAMALPDVSKLQCRRFLDLGFWKDEPAGTVLTGEGEAVRQLYFLVSGGADVNVSGNSVAHLDPPALVGEMAVVMKLPASATVTLTGPSRLLCIEAGVLEVFLHRNPAVRHALDSRIANHIGAKLSRSNAALSARA